MFGKKLFLALLFFAGMAEAGSVPVHDPSVIVVYKDASGNSYPENDAAKSRTKYYYIFGTMNGAAYSRDMLDWTAFTPKLSRGDTTYVTGNESKDDYYTVFKAEADYAEHTTSSDAKGNLWAPDIVWNRKLKKWCLYFSMAGEDWKSSIVMLTADNIEGPYEYKGAVIYGGMDKQTAGSAANADYAKVTGGTTIDERYYIANNGTTNLGKWDGGYGSSCIDPNVFYDEDGNLWLLYGSWSGGLFLVKLDESTGLRDYGYKYGSGGAAKWSGTSLQEDPYMGIHVGGGYYVSGEGSYIQYFKDADGNGYYYLFVSYGFYSPEGGYSMRVFRSKDVKGPYTDVDGTSAIFEKFILNYWGNTDRGFPIMQNYRWSFWDEDHAEIANGHNSLLQDDGAMYLVYHRKYNNHTGWHNVETHQLFFNKKGWIVAAPFEYHEGYGLPKRALDRRDIAGPYKVIMHNPPKNNPATWEDSVAVNLEQDMQLNADGTVTGAYTGTWVYDYARGSSFVTLTLGGVVYEGVMLDQLQNDTSIRTYTFSAMNAAGTRAFWGYRLPKTKIMNETRYLGDSVKVIGKKDFSTAWDAYAEFETVKVSGNFALEYEFKNNVKSSAENWNNWVLVFRNGDALWYLRADAYSLESFGGEGSVGYWSSWGTDWAAFKNAMAGANLKLRVEKDGYLVNVFAFLAGGAAGGGDSLVYAVTANGTPIGDYEVLLGVDGAYLELNRIAYGVIENRTVMGRIDDGGVYNSAFNTEKSADYKVSGDFNASFHFMNFGNKPVYGVFDANRANNWDNYIVRATAEGATTLLRADAYAMDNKGTFTYDFDWNWDDFVGIMRNADVVLDVSRSSDTVIYSATVTAQNGKTYRYRAVNGGASTADMMLGLTCEKSVVDLLSVSVNSTVGKASAAVDTSSRDSATTLILEAGQVARTGSLPASLRVSGKTLLVVTASDRSALGLFNALGHKVMDVNLNASGEHRVSLETLPKGTYFAVLKSGAAMSKTTIRVK